MSAIGEVINRTIDGLDATLKRFRTTAVAVAVIKRYGDDRGSRESALITFYGTLSVFPLLLLLTTLASKIPKLLPKCPENFIIVTIPYTIPSITQSV